MHGRELTVVGTLHGTLSQKVGDYDYTYPRVEADAVYLWPKRVPMQRYSPGFYDPFWGPGFGPVLGRLSVAGAIRTGRPRGDHRAAAGAGTTTARESSQQRRPQAGVVIATVRMRTEFSPAASACGARRADAGADGTPSARRRRCS